jgi:hypothetical protein
MKKMPDETQETNPSSEPLPGELQRSLDTLTRQIEKQNELLFQFVENQTNFRKRIVAGIWTGLGTVLGATVMVSVVVLALKPLANVQWISPIVKKVIDDLETRQPLTKSPQSNR